MPYLGTVLDDWSIPESDHSDMGADFVTIYFVLCDISRSCPLTYLDSSNLFSVNTGSCCEQKPTPRPMIISPCGMRHHSSLCVRAISRAHHNHQLLQWRNISALPHLLPTVLQNYTLSSVSSRLFSKGRQQSNTRHVVFASAVGRIPAPTNPIPGINP